MRRLLSTAPARIIAKGGLSPSTESLSFSRWFEKEERDERNRLQLAAFLDALYRENIPQQQSTAALSAPRASHGRRYPEHLLSPADVESFLKSCLNDEWIVHEKLLHATIIKAERLLHDRHNISVPKVGRVIVVGDLHGDLASLAHIIRKNGLPSSDTAYIFNGDIVDRGVRSSEVLYLVLELLLRNPDSVFINRGNHEDSFLNCAYGFKSELYGKYGVANGRVLRDSLTRLYSSMPLCSWISKSRTFVAHAGPPLLLPEKGSPRFSGNNAKTLWGDISSVRRHSCSRTQADPILEALLWSDPSSDPSATGLQPNSSRGAGLIYGADMLDMWMRAEGVHTFIRSHQCIQFGVEKAALQTESRSSYTVFSSTNYRGSGNEGAVIVLSPGGDGPDIKRFHSDDIETDRFVSSLEKDPHCHDAYSREVVTSIFRALDKDSLGFLTLDEVERALILAGEIGRSKEFDHGCVVENMGIGMGLDLRQWLEKMDGGDGRISIEEFLRLFM